MYNKLISSMIVVALLNLISCYSQKEISYDEFRNLNDLTEAIVVTRDTQSIYLTSDSLKNRYMYWHAEIDSLTIYSTHLEKAWSTALKQVTDSISVSKNDIAKVYVDEFDEAKTIIAVAIPVTLIILIVIGINNMTGAGIGGGNY